MQLKKIDDFRLEVTKTGTIRVNSGRERRVEMIDRKKVRKILLIFERPSIKGNYAINLPPLGILYLDAMLEKAGFVSSVIDANVMDYDINEAKDFDMIGFSLFCSNVERTFEKIRQIRSAYPEKQIILGGPHFKAFAGEYLENPDINAVFVGEGEASLLEYLTAPDISRIKGVYYRENLSSKYAYNGPCTDFADVNTLPFPSFGKLPIQKYTYYPTRKKRFVGIMTSRGCPYQCTFCFHNMGQKWRPRSPENIVDEIRFVHETLKVDEFCIYDDNFSLDKKRVIDFCRLVRENKLNVALQLSNGIRGDLCDEEMIKNLKEAGVWLIFVAPESGNEKTLELIQKGFSLNSIKRTVTLCKKYGIKTWANFIIGFPWEDRAAIQNTCRFAKELDTDAAHFTKLFPFPGSSLFMKYPPKKPIPPYRDISFFTSEIIMENSTGLSNEEINTLIRRCVRAFYLRAGKLLSLLTFMSPKKLIKLALYSLLTKNI